MSSIGFGIVFLVVVAFVLGTSALASHRRLSWKGSLTLGLGSLLWASPVIAVLAFVAVRVIPYFQFGAANHHAPTAKPSWLQSDDETKTVELVPYFSNETMDVSTDESSKEKLPEWTSHKIQLLAATKGRPEQEHWRIVLESDWEVSPAKANEKLSDKAARLVGEDFHRFSPGGSALPAETVRNAAVRAEALAEETFNEDTNPFKMYKAYWQVELSPEVRQQVSDTWKQEISIRRAWLLGAVLMLFTLIAGTLAAYFRLDERSNGQHRTRLKLAAAALMTAGGLGVLATLPLLV